MFYSYNLLKITHTIPQFKRAVTGKMQRSTFLLKTLTGPTIPVVLTMAETSPAAVLEEIVAQVPAEYHDSRIICAGKNILDCAEELSRGVGVYFNKLAAVYIIASAPKRNFSEDSAQVFIEVGSSANTKKQKTISSSQESESQECSCGVVPTHQRCWVPTYVDLKKERDDLHGEVSRLGAALAESERAREVAVETHREERARLLEKISELNHIAERRSRISGAMVGKKPLGKKVFAPEDF